MANHLQLFRLLGPASGGVCLSFCHPCYQFILPVLPENLEIIVDAEFITVNFLLATLFTSQLTTFTAAARPGHVCMHHSQHQDCPSGRGHVNTLNQILIGILPSSRPEREEQGNALRQGLGGLAVTQNFAHHPKDCRGSVGHFYERYDHLPR